MKPEKLLRTAAAVWLLFSALLLPAAARRHKIGLTLLAGVNLFAASGSDSDYVAGKNDFPRSPAYSAPAIGLITALVVSPHWAWTVDVRYGLSAAIDLSDPSDHETIRADTPKCLTAVVGGQRSFSLSRSLTLYAGVGAGIEYLQAEEKEFISNLGNHIIVSAPAKPLSPLLAAGFGVHCAISSALAIGMECRASYALRERAQWVITPAAVLALRF